MTDSLDNAAEYLARADSVLFVTVAGISADSGLPTYRGIGGLYRDADTEEGISIEKALSGPMLHSRPELCWKHIADIERACRGARPNGAHRAIAAMESALGRVCVLTQNVDGLHRAAGSTNVIAIHGDVHVLLCTSCDWRRRVEDYSGLVIPPSCPRCDSLVRPDVVLFEEALPSAELGQLQTELELGFDLVFSIGTTSLFPYIAAPVLSASRLGVPTIEVNPDETTVSDAVDVRLRMGAEKALTSVWEKAQFLRNPRLQ